MGKGNNYKWIAATVVLTTLLSPIALVSNVKAEGGAYIATAATKFSDLSQAHADAQDDIVLSEQRGVMTGNPDGTFRPLDSISRAEFAVVMSKALRLDVPGGDAPGQGSSFADVSESNWAQPYIEAVYHAGLMKGDGKNFHPQGQITRAEVAVVLAKAAGLDVSGTGGGLTFQDADAIPSWAKAAVKAVTDAGLMKADGANFNPTKLAVREEVAVVSVQLMNSRAHVIEGISDEGVVISGVTYQLADALRSLFASQNLNVLSGAKIDAKIDGNTITSIDRLEVTSSGQAAEGTNSYSGHLVLDGQGATFGGELLINGDYVTVKNLTVTGSLKVEDGVKHQWLADQVTVSGQTELGNASSVLQGGSFGVVDVPTGANVQLDATVNELHVSGQPLPHMMLGSAAKVNNLVLPTGIKGADVFEDYTNHLSQVVQINDQPNPDWPQTGSVSHPVVYDKNTLTAKLAEAQSLLDEAVVGEHPGQYPQAALDALNSAVQAATVVNDNADATPDEVKSAVKSLLAAINSFQQAQVPQVPLTFSAISGAKLYVNSGMTGDSDQITLGTSQTPFYMYDKQSLAALVSVKDKINPISLMYDMATDQYKVMDDGIEVGELTVTSSKPTLLPITPSSSGDLINPQDDLLPSSRVSLQVHLWQNHHQVKTVSVPVVLDETAPRVTHAAYSSKDHMIKVTMSENMVPAFGGPNPVTVLASAKGDFSDAVTLSWNTDYAVTLEDNCYKVQLLDPALSNVPAGSKYRIVVNTGADYAANSVDPQANSADVVISNY